MFGLYLILSIIGTLVLIICTDKGAKIEHKKTKSHTAIKESNKKLKIAVIVLSVIVVLCIALIAIYNAALNDVYQQLEEARAELSIANEKINQCEQEKKQLKEEIETVEYQRDRFMSDVEFYKEELKELKQKNLNIIELEDEDTSVLITSNIIGYGVKDADSLHNDVVHINENCEKLKEHQQYMEENYGYGTIISDTIENLYNNHSTNDICSNCGGDYSMYNTSGAYEYSTKHVTYAEYKERQVNNTNADTKTEASNNNFNQTREDVTTNEPTDAKVYWTSGGKSYHSRRSCPTLSRSKNINYGSNCPKSDPCNVCN